MSEQIPSREPRLPRHERLNKAVESVPRIFEIQKQEHDDLEAQIAQLKSPKKKELAERLRAIDRAATFKKRAMRALLLTLSVGLGNLAMTHGENNVDVPETVATVMKKHQPHRSSASESAWADEMRAEQADASKAAIEKTLRAMTGESDDSEAESNIEIIDKELELQQVANEIAEEFITRFQDNPADLDFMLAQNIEHIKSQKCLDHDIDSAEFDLAYQKKLSEIAARKLSEHPKDPKTLSLVAQIYENTDKPKESLELFVKAGDAERIMYRMSLWNSDLKNGGYAGSHGIELSADNVVNADTLRESLRLVSGEYPDLAKMYAEQTMAQLERRLGELRENQADNDIILNTQDRISQLRVQLAPYL